MPPKGFLLFLSSLAKELSLSNVCPHTIEISSTMRVLAILHLMEGFKDFREFDSFRHSREFYKTRIWEPTI